MRKTASQVLTEISYETGYSVSELIGPRRTSHLAKVRMKAYYRIYTECPHLSLPSVGRVMGGRDHTTILSGLRKHCESIGISYRSISRKPVYVRGLLPYVRNANIPPSIDHYRKAQRYAV